jgi:hypothetical protein
MYAHGSYEECLTEGCIPVKLNLLSPLLTLSIPPILKYQLLSPLATVLQNALKSNFADVEVEEVDCPDLSKKPWSLAAEGYVNS